MTRLNEVGEKLKDARKAKGYTLDDLQQMTKIQKRYLIAVEEGNLDVLPGNFYARAFIKQYADTVGLNGEQLLKEHSGIPDTKGEDYTEKVITTQTRSKKKSNGMINTIQDSLPTILIVLLVLAIVVVFYIFAFNNSGENTQPVINQEETADDQGVEVGSNEEASNDESTGNESEETNQNEQSEETPSDTETDENAAEEQQEEEQEEGLTVSQVSSTGRETTYSVTGTQTPDQEITLSAEGGDSWVSVTVDGTTVDQQLLEAGGSLTAPLGEGIQTVTVVIGNAAVTSVQLNGQPVESAEESANAVRQELTFEFE